MSSFTGSFGDESPVTGSTTRPFDDDGYIGYDPRIQSQRFDSFTNFDANSVKDSVGDSSPIFGSQSYSAGHEVFSPLQEASGGFGATDGSVLPPSSEMEPEEGFALREWRRQNAISLEKKETLEKELLQQIIAEAEEYKAEFYRKCHVAVENNKASNREKEKLFLANRDKFHTEAGQNYWKAIGELIPREVPTIKKRGKKDQENKKPSIVVIQGPKPGKPTDLSRMRHILLKLKHNPPPHMKPKPVSLAEPKKDAKAAPAPSGAASTKTAVVTPEPKATA
ncbi:clathrin light chain 3 [Tripterygium wilfordii]|uniref:Clathrin light chain n=1 Tax=Tripterygium wilfordii TaxID=458696 RepID=A0A7J7CT19_TRIWF|nr:clathrin light chain 2-like [Tripterygium wilfordii]KAF5737230.1 clathrin light chain 3 [Tripterygium wilfordii]